MIRLVRDIEFRGHGFVRLLAIGGTVDQLPNQLGAITSHTVEQRFGNKTRRLGQPEGDMRSAHFIDSAQEGLIFYGGESVVKRLSQGGNHVLNTMSSLCHRAKKSAHKVSAFRSRRTLSAEKAFAQRVRLTAPPKTCPLS